MIWPKNYEKKRKSALYAVDIMTMNTNMSIIIMIMTKNADVDADTIMNTNIIITIMTKNADVDADMTMIMIIITTIIMQMKYLQAGVKKHLRNIRKKNWKKSYRNYLKMTVMA